MPGVYAVLFEIGGSSPAPPTFEDIVSEVSAWVRGWYDYWIHIDFSPPDTDSMNAPSPGHSVETEAISRSPGSRLWSIHWSYPDPSDTSMGVQIDASVTEESGKLEFGLLVGRESKHYRISPSPFDLRAPFIVRKLIRTYRCSIQGQELRPEPTYLDVETLEEFVPSVLSNFRRAIPIVLVTSTNAGQVFLIDPRTLSHALVGLANVYVIRDRSATFALGDAVGRELNCFDGAVRIYWPGLTDDPRVHRLYFPDRIARLQANGDLPEHEMLASIASVSALRYSGAPKAVAIRADVRDSEERRAENELAELRRKVEQGDTGREGMLDRIRALELIDRERSKRVKYLESENAKLREAISLPRGGIPSPDATTRGEGTRQGAGEPIVTTVADALFRARAEFEDYLEFTRSAIDSSEESHSRRSQEAFRALASIREVARDYFLGLEAKTGLGEPMEKAFGRRGFHFKLKDSATTSGKFGKQRTFSYKGVPTPFEMHLTLGGGDRQDPVQIYFLIDTSTRRFVIGYCGIHLDYSRGRT